MKLAPGLKWVWACEPEQWLVSSLKLMFLVKSFNSALKSFDIFGKTSNTTLLVTNLKLWNSYMKS